MVLSVEVQKLYNKKISEYRMMHPEAQGLSNEEIKNLVVVTEEDILDLRRTYFEALGREIKELQSEIEFCESIIATERGAAVTEAYHEKASYSTKLAGLQAEYNQLSKELMESEKNPGSR